VRDYHASVIARANAERRILLTRDRKLLLRREPVVAFYISSNDTRAQFDEVCAHFSISVRPEDLMSRCSRCNHCGYVHMTSADVARALERDPLRFDVPTKVLAKIDEYWLCPFCDKLYWEGPRYGDTRASFWLLFEGQPGFEQPEEALADALQAAAAATAAAAAGAAAGEARGEGGEGGAEAPFRAAAFRWKAPPAAPEADALRAFASKAPDAIFERLAERS
jgi:uncharacterized protein with PIN domain